MWAFSLFSKSDIGHVNHGKSENICGVGVSSTFLAVMRFSNQFFVVLGYSEQPNAPLCNGCLQNICDFIAEGFTSNKQTQVSNYSVYFNLWYKLS